MNSILTSIILGASIILEVILELKGIRVPDVVFLLSGFAVRHIIGGETTPDITKTTPEVKNAIPIVDKSINP